MATGYQSSWNFFPWTRAEMGWGDRRLNIGLENQETGQWILALSLTSCVSQRRTLRFWISVPSSAKQGSLNCSQRPLPARIILTNVIWGHVWESPTPGHWSIIIRTGETSGPGISVTRDSRKVPCNRDPLKQRYTVWCFTWEAGGSINMRPLSIVFSTALESLVPFAG